MRILRRVAFTNLGIFVIVGLVCWFGGWRTLQSYGLGLILSGVLALSLGAASTMGETQLRGSWIYQYGRTVSDETDDERGQEDRENMRGADNFFMLMLAISMVPLAVGTLLLTAFH